MRYSLSLRSPRRSSGESNFCSLRPPLKKAMTSWRGVQIGRGSCRGRGWNSGGAGSLKKKKRKGRRRRFWQKKQRQLPISESGRTAPAGSCTRGDGGEEGRGNTGTRTELLVYVHACSRAA